jgi:hypothetical protein
MARRPIMPWILRVCAVIFVGGCWFNADYGGGNLACSDGKCPSGLVCHADRRCGAPIDAAADDAADASLIDARLEALTCADPGLFAATGGTRSGTTVLRTSMMSSLCGGSVMNGPDAVFKIVLPAASSLRVDITGGRKAYVIGTCVPSPSTPACIGNSRAAAGSPLTLAPVGGPAFVVVDDENAAASSTFALTLTVN